MKRTNYYLIIGGLLAFLFLGFLSSCGGCTRPKEKETTKDSSETDKPSGPFCYNFYVENSGSVKGYFYGNSNNASVILKEFYDRIDESKGADDVITLNYINNTIKKQETDISTWLNQIYSNCNEEYSDIDKVLEQSLGNTNDNTINIVLSDYCFESKFGSLDKAKSEITKVFTKGLQEYKDLAIAIYKYEATFNGKYYPGGYSINGLRPLYLWIFGPSKKLKEIVNLPIEQKEEAKMFLQPQEVCIPTVVTNNARMTNKERTEIVVKNWQEDRHEDNLYKVDVSVDLSKVIMPSSEILDVKKYDIQPTDYYVYDIKKDDKDDGNGKFTFTIATKRKPYACQLSVNYSSVLPNWVELSNFEQESLPKDSTTYGIKSLIEGANNAYKNKSNNIFTINLNLI